MWTLQWNPDIFMPNESIRNACRYMELDARKPVLGTCDHEQLKRAQLQRLTRILKVCMQEVKLIYRTSQKANNKFAGQTARMRRLDCAFVVSIKQSQGFTRRGQISNLSIIYWKIMEV